MEAAARQFLLPTAADIEMRARDRGMSIPAMCDRAGISPSTFYRWLAGESIIKADVMQKLIDVTAPITQP